VELDHDSPVPLWEQLVVILRRQITSGEMTGRVPSARTLAQQYEVSHRTSERALNALKDEGLVVAVIGKGFYVKR
jgi:DNA-binding GntR family transcriptional regulator